MSVPKRNVFVAGHNGMVGSAIVKLLEQQDDVALIIKSRDELDLTNQSAVNHFFEQQQINQVYIAAAKVGGIYANNTYPADFIYQNLMIQCNLIQASHKYGVGRLLLLGSSCIYPKYAEQPMHEKALLSGELEPSNEPYAIAKIAGIKMCESYRRQFDMDCRSVMPTNLYGENDNFHPENSHVIPALIQRFHWARKESLNKVVIWGSGNARREFLHADDLASACLYTMSLPAEDYCTVTSEQLSHLNVGVGEDISIRDLALLIADIVGYQGDVDFDTSKPDGAPKKLLDVSKLNQLGWRANISLKQGLIDTYQWYLEHLDGLRTA